MISAFGRPYPFTLAGVDIVKVNVRTDGGDPSVQIFIRDRTASYLDLHVEDGARRAGNPCANRRGLIVLRAPGAAGHF